MAKNFTRGTPVTLPKVRLGYCKDLFTPKELEVDGKKRLEYSAELLFSKEAEASQEFKNLLKSLQDCAVVNFGAEAKKAKLAIKRQHDNGNIPNGLDEGCVFVRASTGFAPEVMKINAFGALQKIDESEIYGGCYVTALVTPYPVVNPKTNTRYIQLNLNAVVKLEDGEKLYQAEQVDYNSAFAAFGVTGIAQNAPSAAPESDAGELPSY